MFTLQITHKIDADIDVERDYIVESAERADPAVVVDVLSDFTTSYHSRNGGGDSVYTDGNLPVIDVTAVVPDPLAPDLRPGPPSGVPLQVWLPALINLLVVPSVAWSTLHTWSHAETDHVLAATTVVGSLIIAVMAFAIFARSALARRVLLAIAAVVGLSHIGGLFYDATDLRSGHALGAMVAILVLVALSSPKATEWTTRRS